MTDYRNGEIHIWKGGECPVHPKDKVSIWFRCFRPAEAISSNSVNWGHSNSSGDIIAFQVTERHEEPLTIWVNLYPDDHHFAYATKEDAKRSASESATRIAVPFQEVKK